MIVRRVSAASLPSARPNIFFSFDCDVWNHKLGQNIFTAATLLGVCVCVTVVSSVHTIPIHFSCANLISIYVSILAAFHTKYLATATVSPSRRGHATRRYLHIILVLLPWLRVAIFILCSDEHFPRNYFLSPRAPINCSLFCRAICALQDYYAMTIDIKVQMMAVDWVWVLGYIHRCVLCANNVNRMLLKFVGNDLLQLILVKNVAATAQKNETYRRRRCWVKWFCRKTTKKSPWRRERGREKENCSGLTLLCWKTHLIAAAGVAIAIQLFSATN